MSAEALVATWARPARWRSVVDDLAIGTPAVLAAAALAWRWHGTTAALVATLAGLALLAAIAALRARRFDRGWLVRALDPDLEDSAGLLIAPDSALGPLQRLQRARVEARLAAPDIAPPRPPWHPRVIAASWAAGVAIAALALASPATRAADASRLAATPPAGPPRLAAQQLVITPPAYTGEPRRRLAALDARAPEGARLDWRLRFTAPPARVELVTIDGRRFGFARLAASPDDADNAAAADTWTLTRRLERSLLYRIVVAGSPDPAPLHRIDAVADAAPVIRVLDPPRTLTLLAPGQRRWRLAFEASDDHGLAATARLRLIVTSGAGENIAAAETALTLAGTGSQRRRRFTAVLDPAALGLTPGNDLVAQLTVTDRAPIPHSVRSPSLILRRPAERGPEAGGLDLAVKTVMPAYFRSQRQIIIDAEQLLRERRRLAPDRFAARADALGEDQRILRLRYGQYLGQDGSDAPALPTNDAPAPAPAPATIPAPTEPAAPALPAGHTAGDGHDHPPPKAAAGFGDPASVTADYGHAHGDDESTSLPNPATRALLAQALDAMFSSERELRQAAPAQALPHAYAALRLIKQVQQATRIYLARTGPDLPPLDLARRLGGDRKGLAAPRFAALPAPVEAATAPAAAWRALAGPGPVALDDLERWLATAPPLADPLALAAAIDAVRRDPGCTACRRTLRARLWRVLPPPPAQVTRRPAVDPAGARYLGGLR